MEDNIPNYLVTVFDIKDITKPKRLTEFNIVAESKQYALDIAHSRAEELYPTVNRLVETRNI